MRDFSGFTDERLVGYVRDKDQEAYKEVVKRYQQKLFRYAEYILGDKDLAEDAVQEAFIKAFVNLQSFDTKRKFSSWIYRIVHNQAVNKIKKKRRLISLDANEWLQSFLSYEPNYDQKIIKEELKKQLKECLKKLPLKYRSVLTLFFYEEKSYQEMSDILRIPVSTVGVRIRRGKKLLQEKCNEEKS
jgi:RNA polymerase sigma-70 factor (ECF subfamily)